MPLLISTVVMFQSQKRETINSTWKVALSFKADHQQDHYDDEHDKIVFHETTPDVVVSWQDLGLVDQDRFFGLRLVLS